MILPSEAILYAIGVNILAALGLYLPFATGQFSFAGPVFMCVGAYVSGIFTVKLGISIIPAMVLSSIITGIFGLITGFPALRVRGLYLAFLTIGLIFIVQIFFRNLEWVGGVYGFKGMRGSTLGLIYGTTAVCLIGCWILFNSSIGKAFEAVREDEFAAEQIGIDTTVIKLSAFFIGAFISSLSGALWAHFAYYIHTDSYGIETALKLITFIVVGGIETMWGPILGAIILTLLPEYIRPIMKWHVVIYGGILMLMMIFRPVGIISRFQALRWKHQIQGMIQKRQ